MRGDPSSKNLEEPSGDGENSACIGAEEELPEVLMVQVDASFGPEADQVYGSRWDG